MIYRRAQHAAHYGYGHPAKGHDLESWDVAQAWTDPRPADVPPNAEKHSGYVKDGVQYVVFVRVAPLSGPPCDRCPKEPQA